MLFRRAIRGFWRPVGAPLRWARRARSVHPRFRPEFPRVNAQAGIEPLRPELSGLGMRRAAVPLRVTRVLIQLAYRWHPSREHRRRQAEMRLMNQWLRHGPKQLDTLPPILSYVEESDLAPTRLQPMLDPGPQEGPLSDLPRDLTDLEQQAPPLPRLIRPRITAVDPEYLLNYRPLLPRQYRHFLRYSPYPRVAAGLVALVTAIGGFIWISQLQQAEAVAAGRARAVQQAFQAQLSAARAYGLSTADLRQLGARAQALQALPPPVALIPSRARVHFYRQQTQVYVSLLGELRLMEQRALTYWTSQETSTYTSLVGAIGEVNDLGLDRSIPAIPACSAPACDQQAITAQQAEIRWLHQTAQTLRQYTAQAAASADPASTVGTEIQEVHNLAALVTNAPAPVHIERLDDVYGSAGEVSQYAQVAALAHLERDALATALTRSLPARAIVVSIENGTLTCFNDRKPVLNTPATAGSGTPTGRFHLEAKQSSISSVYWNRSGRTARYRYGSILDWMPFSGTAALQAAPWRTAYGPGAGNAVAAYAPDTPDSVDLPPDAAGRVFTWATPGVEVLVY